MIKGSGRANILLPNNTKLGIKDALYLPESRRNLLSFKDVCAHGYHTETIDEDKKKYLYIISCISGQKLVLKKLHVFFFGIYYTIMKSIETNIMIHQNCSYLKIFMLWHDWLGHPGSIMMRWIIETSHGHPLKNLKIFLPSEIHALHVLKVN